MLELPSRFDDTCVSFSDNDYFVAYHMVVSTKLATAWVKAKLAIVDGKCFSD